MLTLFEAHDDDPQTTFERDTTHLLGTKFERLQASLNNLHRVSSLRKVAPEKDPQTSPGSIEWRHIADMGHLDTCRSLAGKRVTMVGGEHIYRLHVLLLQHRERTEKRQFPCPYHEFCTHHHICLPFQHSRDDEPPPPRYIKPPTTQELTETGSATVSYVVSDTLFSGANESSWEYTLPYVDSATGVRLRETYWLAAARKASVVILGRGPLGAPGETFSGNWSSLRHVPDYVDKLRTSTIGEYDDEHTYQVVPHSLEILNAAVHLTVTRFLPELLQLLESIRREVRPSKQKRLLWPSSWYRLPGRGTGRIVLLRPHVRDVIRWKFFHDRRASSSTEHVLALQLSALIDADVTKNTLLEDPWTLLFNAQVYLQNMVLREVLPQFGIVFLPLDDVIWVGGGHGRRHFRDTKDVDFERSMAIGEAFLRRMDYVLRYLE